MSSERAQQQKTGARARRAAGPQRHGEAAGSSLEGASSAVATFCTDVLHAAEAVPPEKAREARPERSEEKLRALCLTAEQERALEASAVASAASGAAGAATPQRRRAAGGDGEAGIENVPLPSASENSSVSRLPTASRSIRAKARALAAIPGASPLRQLSNLS